MRVLLIFLCGLIAVPLTAGQQTRPVSGLHENRPELFAFTEVTLYINPETRHENATLVIRDGVVEAAGPSVTIPEDATVIAMPGKTIYPGFIDLYSHHGLKKAAAKDKKPKKAAAQGTTYWNANVTPERGADTLWKPDEKHAGILRKAGFTTVLTTPSSGVVRGSGALVLTGDEPGQVLSGPHVQTLSLKGGQKGDYPGSQMGALALIRQSLADAAWYGQAWDRYQAAPDGKTPPERNLSLEALSNAVRNGHPFLARVENELEVLRIGHLLKDHKLEGWVIGGGQEYRRIDLIKESGVRLIVPLKFPDMPNVADPAEEMDIDLRTMRHWHRAPENAALLEKSGLVFALSMSGHEKADGFLKALRKAHQRGLSEKAALAALTTTPAAWLKQSHTLGSLEPGRMANFIVTDGNLFDEDTRILEARVKGYAYEIVADPADDVRGDWQFQVGKKDRLTLSLSGTAAAPSGTLKAKKAKKGKGEKKLTNVTWKGRTLVFAVSTTLQGQTGFFRAEGRLSGDTLSGTLHLPDGGTTRWEAKRSGAHKAKEKKAKETKQPKVSLPLLYPDGAFGRQEPPQPKAEIIVRGATIWTSSDKGILANADLLIRDGKIVAVGENLEAGADAFVIDGKGKHVTAGLIDEHSHTAIDGGANEFMSNITSEVSIGDVVDSDDINIYRGLAGGQTMACMLHGSANPIGGQNAVVKFRWGHGPQAMLFDGAMPGIKFALGENVKKSNSSGPVTRYPATRMGVDQFFRDRFRAAMDYRREWKAYEAAEDREQRAAPRKNYRLEALVEILEGKRQIHCHSYRQDEILALMRVAEDFGFRIDTFTHILEGYKVADIMAAHGAMGSSFSDWWAYKYEVKDAIPYNGALMHEQGVVVSFNSDSPEMARRLNLEAAKAVKYGGVSPEEAIKFVTLNPARQLRIEDRVGSLEPGKDGDFVIWSGSPLSTFSICEQTWIDGTNYFNREEDATMRTEARQQRAALIQHILDMDKDGSAPKAPTKRPKPGYTCHGEEEHQ